MRAWLELARLSNVPTLVTNVLVGAALGGSGRGLDGIPWLAVSAVAAAVILFYIGGMAMNDVVDRDIDRQQRPGRPIPSGRITVGAAAGFAVACLATGVGLAALAGPPALLLSMLLVAAIVLYNRSHKVAAASVVLMGACRAMVYLMAAAAVAWPPDPVIATTLVVSIAAYIAFVSVVARVETGTMLDGRRWTGIALLAPALAPIAVLRPETWTWTVVATVIVVVWLLGASRYALARPPRLARAVPAWLAGICLLDGLYLALLDEPALGGVALGCFIVTTIAHRRILGT